VGRSGGKQTLAMMSKRIPLVGGGVGMATDGWFTWTVASYARDVFAPRRLPELPSPEQVVDEEQPAPQPEPDVRDAEWSEEDD
ncbi:MAG: hypothetical protein L0H80_03215, partial [Propionibacterium sp.]|nr:hypothetical protein [Propionibacterium sp.]